jgi:hypothetical protein
VLAGEKVSIPRRREILSAPRALLNATVPRSQSARVLNISKRST